MRTILSIFRNDIGSLSRRFFALAIIVGISVLPALYAWVNIYANGNPYGNTGNIRIAVASNDPGIDLEDGKRVWKEYETLYVDGEDFDAIGTAFETTGKVRYGSLGNARLRHMRRGDTDRRCFA